MDSDKGSITSECDFEVTGGHTPYPQISGLRKTERQLFMVQTIFLKWDI